jgi:hypothetical protein
MRLLKSRRSMCVKSQKWAQRGVRLVDKESFDLFMEDKGSPKLFPQDSSPTRVRAN